MKKLLLTIFILIFSSSASYSDDYRFIQVDGVLLNSADNLSVKNMDSLIDRINKEKNVGFVVFTGNNISKPTQSNLEQFLKQAGKLNAPYYVVLGQKDVNKQKKLGKADYIKWVNKKNPEQRKYKEPNFTFLKKGLVFIAADGSKEVIPTPNGYYRSEVINRIDVELNKYNDKNVIIIQHYPIIPPSNKESYYTYNADEYLKMLSKHQNVKAVVSGHFDVNKEQEINGIMHISTSNAPVYRIIDIMNYKTQHPVIWSVIKE